jgi:hypothetical protein
LAPLDDAQEVTSNDPRARGGPVRAWARRTTELHRELAAIADVDPRWWLLAGGVALAEVHAPPEIYLASDAEADADTFMGFRAHRPGDGARTDAIRAAHAARRALRELDGELPDQPLAVTIDRHAPTLTAGSALDVAAFALGDGCVVARLDDPTLPAQLVAALAGAAPARWAGPPPFVCVSLGDEPVETARHGHRRAWTDRGGPWLGVGRAGDLTVVSTCHVVIDGYGHARIAARIAELTRPPASEPPSIVAPGRLAAVPGAVPLAVVWRALPYPTPRVIPLAYAAGRLLHRDAGRRDARFSPTLQIPVARGRKDDPLRLRRRVVSATTSVRFADGEPEPFAAFDARVRAAIAREAAARGLVSRLLAAARAVPVPTAWKRKSIGAKRPPWLESFAEVIGGRALLSRIALDRAAPTLCAVSSPSRLATAADPVGGCVVTIIDDGTQGAITLCGSGFAGTPARASAFLDELLAGL